MTILCIEAADTWPYIAAFAAASRNAGHSDEHACMHAQGKGSANERTRTTITAGLKKKLKDLMGEFSEMRTRIQEEYREVVERRVYTVTGACTCKPGFELRLRGE